MKKKITSLLCAVVGVVAYGQWSPVAMQGKKLREEVKVQRTYALDVHKMKNELSKASLEAKGAKPVEIVVPGLDGKMHRFAVYSRPVVAQSLAERYDLGSYVGFGIDDPSLYLRFSLSGNDFQSMLYKDGEYQFIEPLNADKTVYGVFPKTKKTAGGKVFECSTTESEASKKDIDALYEALDKDRHHSITVTKASDRKFRTYRLALAVTGEYTQTFGGKQGALTQMNATMTRVNGVYEKDMALNLMMQDLPELIYENPAEDPFSNASDGANGSWTMELQKTLTSVVGEANYDIGHLFGASGGGGNAGCIGCVCVSPMMDSSGVPTRPGKGAAYTSPGSGLAQGDTFDIDYVAHEFGHQLGANHTFSHALHPGLQTHVEPGSGSTIMGYAGITNANVQMHSDAYFHFVSLDEMQTNLMAKTCGTQENITNNPPVITPMADATIPKGTAFVLTAEAMDPEGDELTYTWEQVDPATGSITEVTGMNTNGALFRSLPPTTSATRYFPKLSSVLSGQLTVPSDWETVSKVARVTRFRVTVRDNNSNIKEQQTQSSAIRKITVGQDGPFKVKSFALYTNAPKAFEWDVVGTNQAPYNVENVKIDYTKDNGETWVTLTESTANDGSEVFDLSGLAFGDQIKVRVSAIDNVFYAVGNVEIKQMKDCDGSVPLKPSVSNITAASVDLLWEEYKDAKYVLKYRKKDDADWMQVELDNAYYTLSGLEDQTEYEVMLAISCNGVLSGFSDVQGFQTAMFTYCPAKSNLFAYEYISNVTVTPESGQEMSNDSQGSTYTDYSSDLTKKIVLKLGTTNNKISVSKKWPSSLGQFNEAVKAWIDFNRDGMFAESELVLNAPLSKVTPVTNTFTVPQDAYNGNKSLKMRVILSDQDIASACEDVRYGEVEDYLVEFENNLSTSENIKANGVYIYPNPALDILNVNNVSAKATFVIHDMTGKSVSSGKVEDGKVLVSKLQKGVYLISVQDNGTTSNHKFIKK